MDSSQLKNIVEAALLAAGNPLTVGQLKALFGDQDGPEKQEIRAVIKELIEDYEGRGIEVREVASGFRIQVRDEMSQWLSKLWEERPPRYSRALMETLAIVAYRQPVTRGDIEEIRGVSVTSNIIRTLLEREWIKVVGHRDVPGKPAMFGTTKDFLDYFNLKKLDDLPPLAELAQLEPVGVQLELEADAEAQQAEGAAARNDEGDAEVVATEADDAPAEAVAEPAEGDEPVAADAASDEADQELPAESSAEASAEAEEIGDAAALAAQFEDEYADEEPVSDDEVEAAAARIAAITAELSGKDDEEAEEAQDVPPGAVQPLVGLNAPGEEPPEPATVSSLDEARAAAADRDGEVVADAEDQNDQPAEVVPLKTP